MLVGSPHPPSLFELLWTRAGRRSKSIPRFQLDPFITRAFYVDAFSSREPVPTSLENASFYALRASGTCCRTGSTVAMPRNRRPSRSEPVMIRFRVLQTRMRSFSIKSSSGVS
jgi:hypothetical protein